jgi:hypothetical protein
MRSSQRRYRISFPAIALVAYALAMLSACGTRTEPYRTAAMPAAEGFGAAVPAGHTAYDNGSLADLFVRLTHGLETGSFRKVLQRFEEPVNVGITGPGSQDYVPFLQTFLEEIRREAQVPISLGARPHNLLIQFVPGEEFLPEMANQCMVVFGQPDWQTLRADPRPFGGEATRRIDRQTEMSVLIPDTVEPYKVRECLLEEVTQALGTANDLYGVASTIFNDDNAHSWPTRLDYLMLKILYHPEMHSGLTREETRRRALKLLEELNPDGRNAPPLPPIQQTRFLQWRRALLSHENIEDGALATIVARQLAAQARIMAPGSAYDCTGATFLASIARTHGASDAEDLLKDAIETCTLVHGSADLRIADLRLQRSYTHLDAGRYAEARREAEDIAPIFMAHALDGNVAAAYIVQTVAAWHLEDPDWDGGLLERAAAWSAYAYGDDHEMTSKLRPH